MKFIGHLDIMRYFQKAIRRAKIPVAMSEGYSPHQIMSFAMPLGVGLTSEGEYLDIQTTQDVDLQDMVQKLNSVMVEGMKVITCTEILSKTKAMTSVAAADYSVFLKPESFPYTDDWLSLQFQDFYHQTEIIVLKKTKKSEREVDIRPYIYEMHYENDHKIFMKLATGSVNNLKPELVMQAFCQFADIEYHPFQVQINRLELYGNIQNDSFSELKTLEELASFENL